MPVPFIFCPLSHSQKKKKERKKERNKERKKNNRLQYGEIL
jgi:hypothetical protein